MQSQVRARPLKAQGVRSLLVAIAMQDLYNHSEAQQADADYMQQAGEVHANFSSLQGKAAVDAYPQYIQNLKDIREKIGSGLSNGMSQKLYDGQSLSTFGRTVFNGAGHAASENKRYAISSADGRIAASYDQSLNQPFDDKGFQQSLAQNEVDVRAKNSLEGLAPDAIEENVRRSKSSLWAAKITGMAKTQPFTASRVMDQAIKSGGLQGKDITDVTNYVQQANHTVGARMISHDVMTGASGRWGQGEIDIGRAREAIGEIESSGNYSAVGVETKHGRALGKYQVMDEFLPEYLRKAGLPPMTDVQFLNDHNAQDQVFNANFAANMKKTGSANDAASMWISGRTQANAGSTPDALGTNSKTYVARFNAALAGNASLRDKVDMGKSIASMNHPDDVLMPDYAEHQIRMDDNNNKAIERDDNIQRINTISDALQGNLSNGKVPRTVDELKATDPKAAAAYEGLPPPKQIQIQKNMISYNNAKMKETTKATRNELLGLATSENPEDVQKFLDTNIYQQPLSQGDMNFFHKMQTDKLKKSGNSLEINQALNAIKPIIDASGVDPKDKTLNIKLRGAMVDVVQDWHAQNPNKPLDEQTVKKMAVDLVQQHTSENFWYGKDYMFNLPLPDSIKKKMEKDLGRDMTDAEVEANRGDYVRQLFNSVQKAKTATAPTSGAK
jgi:hypothetical protein